MLKTVTKRKQPVHPTRTCSRTTINARPATVTTCCVGRSIEGGHKGGVLVRQHERLRHDVELLGVPRAVRHGAREVLLQQVLARELPAAQQTEVQ